MSDGDDSREGERPVADTLSMGRRLPWPVKIAAKLLLARMPIPYRVWKSLRLFQHGRMEDRAYIERIFEFHAQRVTLACASRFTCLELGPGDSLMTAILAKAWGANQCWLVDVGDFALRDLTPYRDLAASLAKRGLPSPPQEAFASLETLLSWCNARYLTGGIESLREIPSGSVDFMFSQAVLEHIRRREFGPLLYEMRRIVSPTGICSHQIDLRDHLNGALNNLRFSEGIWESEFFANSGFYTNRRSRREGGGNC